MFILRHTKKSAMANIVLGFLNQGCGFVAISTTATPTSPL